MYDILKDYVKTPPKELIRFKSKLKLEHTSSLNSNLEVSEINSDSSLNLKKESNLNSFSSSPDKNNVSTRTDIWFSTLKLPLFNWVFAYFYIKKIIEI